jgi:hypothetical protein
LWIVARSNVDVGAEIKPYRRFFPTTAAAADDVRNDDVVLAVVDDGTSEKAVTAH